jgi:hypothetical protein
MAIALISLLIIICILQYTKDYFIIESNQLISEKEYNVAYCESITTYKVKSYTYKITYKNKRIAYKTYNVIEDGR